MFAYRRRWQIETSFRYEKSELTLESPRLWAVENRLKLLGIVTLVYAFLLHLLDSSYKILRETVIRLKYHRTGKRCKDILTPLYRLRWAMSRLWDESRPLLKSLSPPLQEALRVFIPLRA